MKLRKTDFMHRAESKLMRGNLFLAEPLAVVAPQPNRCDELPVVHVEATNIDVVFVEVRETGNNTLKSGMDRRPRIGDAVLVTRMVVYLVLANPK